MAGFYGGDTEQMRAHADVCRAASVRLGDLIQSAGAAVAGAEWEGPDAEEFRARWTQVAMQLAASSAQVSARGRQLEQEAEEQDDASEDGFSFGDLLPLPMPLPGRPLGPGILPQIIQALPAQLPPGEASWYGDAGYGSGNAASEERPVGEDAAGGSHWDGREIDNDLGYFDGYAHTRASSGANVTEDPFGNVTRSAGARAGAEIGFDEMLYGPMGTDLQVGGRAGAEAYAEAGVTYGDGFSAGASAGAGVYGDIAATIHGPFGASNTIGVQGAAEIEAHANAYSHATRNDEGNINGWAVGMDGGASAAAKGDVTFEAESPGGWLSSSGSFGVQGGASIGGDVGAIASTDEVGLSVGGDIAALVGIEGGLSVSIHPNEIVNDLTPGDYDIDDAISDASGLMDGAKDAAGDALSAINPFD